MWDFVEIVWQDAKADSTWCDEEDLPDIEEIITRGWIVRETNKCVTLAASYSKPAKSKIQVGEVITIPQGCVIKRTLLQVVEA